MDDGIYLMLPLLRPRLHTIHVTSASDGSVLGAFALEVTYYIEVR